MKEVERLFVERRGWPRTAIQKITKEAFVLLRGKGPTPVPPVEIVNLSEAGAGILTTTPLVKGTPVTLRIASEQLPFLEFEAEVRWTTGAPLSTGQYPSGLKFLRLTQESKRLLNGFLQTLREMRMESERPPLD